MRSYVKVARPADVNTRYTAQRAVVGYEGGEGGQGPKGDKGDTGPEGPPGKDGVVDPSKLNMEFNVDQIDLKDADGNFCGLHVKGINGITVSEDQTYGNQSMVISGDSVSLENRIAAGEEVQGNLLSTVNIALIKQQQLDHSIKELAVTKGKVARYTTTEINSVPNVSRPGQLAVNNADPSEVTLVSFGTEDLDSILTKPMANGDIVEFVDVNGNVNRFTVIDGAGSPTLVAVRYVSGDSDFVVGEDEQVYIYPQNVSGASKDYVDEQDALKLNLTGGTLSGRLVTDDIHIEKAADQESGAPRIALTKGGAKVASMWQYGDSEVHFDVEKGYEFKVLNTHSNGTRYSHIHIRNDFTEIHHLMYPTNDDHAASKKYVDDAVGLDSVNLDNYMTLEGENTVEQDFRIKQNKTDGSGKNNYITIHDNYLYLYHLHAPTADHHATNKKYVDDAIAALRTELGL